MDSPTRWQCAESPKETDRKCQATLRGSGLPTRCGCSSRVVGSRGPRNDQRWKRLWRDGRSLLNATTTTTTGACKLLGEFRLHLRLRPHLSMIGLGKNGLMSSNQRRLGPFNLKRSLLDLERSLRPFNSRQGLRLFNLKRSLQPFNRHHGPQLHDPVSLPFRGALILSTDAYGCQSSRT
jgi:hypothetical protein